MGVVGDLLRLMSAGANSRRPGELRENLAASAALAEQHAAGASTPPMGSLGADPFANLAAYDRMLRGSGTVRTIEPTGAEYQGTAVYAVTLEVKLEGLEPYPTRYVTILHDAALPGWAPGSAFPVRVDPQDPNAVSLG